MIREVVEKNFKTRVVEGEGYYKVIFSGIGGQEGHIIFKEAKRGWTNKPISQNTYLVGDADMYQVVDTLKLYMSLTEKELSEVKSVFTSMSLDVLENYLSTPTEHKHKDQDNTQNNSDTLT